MIKTNYKSKPIKGLTHSIGANQISDSLKGIQIYDDLSISFDKDKGNRMGIFVPGWNSIYMKGESRDILDFRRVISGTYSHPLEKWSLNLKAVELKYNKKTKKFLIEIGLPLMRNWFELEKPETWYNGHRNFLIGLNNNLTEYCIWETYNDRTVNKKRIVLKP